MLLFSMYHCMNLSISGVYMEFKFRIWSERNS